MGTRPKRILKILLPASAIGACSYLGILVYAMWDFRSINVIVPLHAKGEISDEVAIEVSSNALIKAGRDIVLLEPRKWNGTNFFARNIYNSSNGYVFWGRKGKPDYAFSVHMELEGDVIRCGVGKTK